MNNDFLKDFKTKREDYFVIWALSDIHPKGAEKHLIQRKQYEDAINDMIIQSVDTVIVAGDIALGTDAVLKRKDYEWYNQLKNKFVYEAKIHYNNWIDIAGNHDNHIMEEYLKQINNKPYYIKKIGNIVILAMSDEYSNYSAEQEISDKGFTWWKEQIKKYSKDNIIINVTHNHALKGTIFQTLRIDSLLGMGIQGTRGMFYEINHYPIDIWLNGHTHKPSWLPTTTVKSKGIIYIDTAAIRKDFWYQNVESRVIYFKKNSNEVLIRTRYHEHKKYIKCLDKLYHVRNKFNIG